MGSAQRSQERKQRPRRIEGGGGCQKGNGAQSARACLKLCWWKPVPPPTQLLSTSNAKPGSDRQLPDAAARAVAQPSLRLPPPWTRLEIDGNPIVHFCDARRRPSDRASQDHLTSVGLKRDTRGIDFGSATEGVFCRRAIRSSSKWPTILRRTWRIICT
jgi:hypothetical protein